MKPIEFIKIISYKAISASQVYSSVLYLVKLVFKTYFVIYILSNDNLI